MSRVVQIAFMGDTRQLEAALERAGLTSEKQAAKFQASADAMGKAAAEQAKTVGASADAQAAAAGKAAGAFTEASAKMSAAQKAAGDAAARAAQVVGASLDAQAAAYRRAAGAQAEYEAAAKRMAAQQARTAASMKSLGAGLAGAGGKVLGIGAAGVGVAGFEGVKGFAALNAEMTKLHTQAGASQAEVNRMTKAAMNMASSVVTGPEDLAKGLYHIESAGFRGTQALKILRSAAEGARVGGANLEDVTNALNAAVVSGIPGVQNYSQAMGALNAIVGSGDMRMQDLADALGTGLLAPMKTYGLTLRDVGAALATFGDNNIRGADAATKLTSAVRIMAAPSKAASKALGVINLSTLQLANDMRSGGLIKALADLRKHLTDSGATASQQGLIIARAFGGRQSVGVQLLLNQLDRVKQKYQEVGAGAHSFSSDVAAYLRTPQAQWHKFTATVQELADKFGQFLIPRLQAVGTATSNVIHWFERHQAAARALAAVLTGVLGTAVAAFAFSRAVAFVNATRTMIGGLAGLASKAGTVAAAMAAKFGLIDASAASTATAVSTADAEMEAANAAAAGSWTTLSAAAATASSTTISRASATAAGVQAADAEIETANAAAGSSFTAMLGPIGAVLAAVTALHELKPGGDINSFMAGVKSKIQAAKSGYDAALQGQALVSTGNAPTRLSGYPDSHAVTTGGGSSALAHAMQTVNAGGGLSHKALQTLLGGGAAGAGGSGRSRSSSTAGHAAWQQIASALHGAGLSNIGIAGALGNFGAESGGMTVKGISPTARNPTSGAFGFAQWLGGRLTALQGYASSRGLSPSSITAQVGYLLQELHGSEHGVLGPLSKATSAAGAARIFEQLFERGGVSSGNMAQRQKLAAQAFGMLGGGIGGSRTIRQLVAANPLPGMTSIGRTDMGVDFSARPGSRVNAIGAGIIDKIIPNWYKGQPLIEEHLTKGPNAGKYIYYAEQIKSLVREGQKVAAGQRIGTVAATGTGLELGFGAGGGRTLAQATTGYTEGQVTPAGRAFAAMLKGIGTHGIYATTNLGTGQTSGGGKSIAQQLADAIQKYNQSLKKSADSITKSYQNLEQGGTTKQIEKALGVSTGGGISGKLHKTIEAVFGSSGPQANPALGGVQSILTRSMAGSQQEKAFSTLVDQLRASHSKAMHELADRLVAEHKNAIHALAQELYAEQVTKDSNLLNAQAEGIKDQTTAAQNAYSSMLEIAKAQEQKAMDAAQAQVQAINDMTAFIRDKWAGVAESIQDATTRMADTSDAIVTGIQDQTAIKVDILGERGLYGLNLIAQQLKVQYDVDKAYWDQQIALSKQNLDAVVAQWHLAVQNAQINVDQVTMQQDANVALAQQTLDTAQITALERIGGAQAHADSVAMHGDTLAMLAQLHVDLLANAPKAQQDIANAMLGAYSARNAFDQAAANQNLTNVTGSANQTLQNAQNAFDTVQSQATALIAAAQQALADVSGQATAAIDTAQQAVQSTSDQASQVLATDQSAVDIATATASTQFAGTGMTVNVYGVPVENASAVGEAVSWVGRSQFGLTA